MHTHIIPRPFPFPRFSISHTISYFIMHLHFFSFCFIFSRLFLYFCTPLPFSHAISYIPTLLPYIPTLFSYFSMLFRIFPQFFFLLTLFCMLPRFFDNSPRTFLFCQALSYFPTLFWYFPMLLHIIPRSLLSSMLPSFFYFFSYPCKPLSFFPRCLIFYHTPSFLSLLFHIFLCFLFIFSQALSYFLSDMGVKKYEIVRKNGERCRKIWKEHGKI